MPANCGFRMRASSVALIRLSLHTSRIRASAQSVELVETAGIEPASAIVHEVASTSVSGALISSRGRLAGGVPRDQPPGAFPGLAEADRPG
jgi:hypothetical protein